MNQEELKKRTKRFALEVIKLADNLPVTRVTRVIADQLIRSGTSVGVNYRAVCRAKSRQDFIFKLGIVEEEADESAYWLELLIELGLGYSNEINKLLKEANELVAIFCSSRKSAKQNTIYRKSQI